MQVPITRLHPSLALPSYQTSGAVGFDLAAAADTTIAPGAVVLVPTGLVVKVPDGHFLGVFARSSTPLKKGLMVANGVGIVDADYCGPDDEIKIEVFNFTAVPVQVKAGERLAQGVLIPFVRADWREETSSTRPARGGFGTTG
jgi:dUTP pyrophosphatase